MAHLTLYDILLIYSTYNTELRLKLVYITERDQFTFPRSLPFFFSPDVFFSVSSWLWRTVSILTSTFSEPNCEQMEFITA